LSVQNLGSRGRYVVVGIGVVSCDAQLHEGFITVAVHYDPNGAVFIAIEKWRVTGDWGVEKREVLQRPISVRKVRDKLTVSVVVWSGYIAVELNGETFYTHLEAVGVSLGVSKAVLFSAGGKISIKHLNVQEGEPNDLVPTTNSGDTAPPSTPQGMKKPPGKQPTPGGKRGAQSGIKPTTVANAVSPPPSLPAYVDKDLGQRIESEIMEFNPNVEWDDIAGISEAKRLLNEAVILPLLVPELFTGVLKPWKGVLMFGPPGTGKTMLAKAVATSSKTTFFPMSSAVLLNRHYGESEKMVRTLFQVARARAPSTIFFDEIDALMSTRDGNEHEVSRRVKAELLQQMDGLQPDSDARVMVLATTNRPWDLDEAIRRRLEKRIYIPLPDIAGRIELLSKQTKQMNIDPEVRLEDIARSTQGFSGADLSLLCRDAMMMPMRRLIDGKSPQDITAMRERGEMRVGMVTTKDFECALEKIQPSVAQSTVTQYDQWLKEFGST
jgi:ATP-dependent 26S proteasome regulatory subunit